MLMFVLPASSHLNAKSVEVCDVLTLMLKVLTSVTYSQRPGPSTRGWAVR